MADNKFLEFFLDNNKHSIKISSFDKKKVTTIQDRYFYSGEHKKGLVHGTGTLEFNGSVLRDGQWKNGHFVNGAVFGSGSDKDRILYVGAFKKGLKHGSDCTEYCKNNVVNYIGDFNKGKRNGQGILRDCDTDKEIYRGSFKNGDKNGKGIEFFRNNDAKIKYDGFFKNNLYHGKGKMYDSIGTCWEGTFKNGKKEGLFRVTSEDGKLKRENRYKNDKLNGICRWYFNSGSLRSVVHYKDGVENGAVKEYFANGKVSFDGKYKNGICKGFGKEFDIHGKLIFIGTFINNDRKKGTMFKNGKKIEGVFLYGEKEGICSIYNSNDRLECKGKFRDDMKDGLVSIYHPNGKLQFKGYFSHNVKNGPGKEYNEQGKLVRSGYWENNVFKKSDSQKKNQKKARENENKIKYFMQTNQKSYLDKVKSADIIAYLKKTANKNVKGTKAKLVGQLEKWRKQLKQTPAVQTGQEMVYNVYLMENVPIDEFLKEDDAIVLINEQGKHFSHVLPQHEIMYECESDRSWHSYVNNPNVKAMIRMTTEGGNYYFLRTDSIIEDMKKGYNVFHFKTHPENVRILSKNVALGGSIISGAHCDPEDIVKISETTKKEKRANGLKMTVDIEF